MEPIISKEEYNKEIKKYINPLRIGIYYTIIFLLLQSVIYYVGGELSLAKFYDLIYASLIAGALFGLLFPVSMYLVYRSLINKVYKPVDIKAKTNGKVDSTFDFFLPGSYLRSKNLSVGGTLYINKEELVFLPHKFNLKMHRDYIRISNDDIESIETIKQDISLFKKLLVGKETKLVRIRSDKQDFTFLFEPPDIFVNFLTDYISKGDV